MAAGVRGGLAQDVNEVTPFDVLHFRESHHVSPHVGALVVLSVFDRRYIHLRLMIHRHYLFLGTCQVLGEYRNCGKFVLSFNRKLSCGLHHKALVRGLLVLYEHLAAVIQLKLFYRSLSLLLVLGEHLVWCVHEGLV